MPCCQGITDRASPVVLSMWLWKINFSHPSLVVYSVATPPIKLKLGQQIPWGLLIANHLNQSLWWANEKQWPPVRSYLLHLLLWAYTNRTWCLWFANDSKCVCCVQSFLLSSKSGSPSCMECSFVQASKLLGVDTIPMTHVQHKTIHKRSSQKKEFIVLIFVKFVETKHPTCWKLFIVPTIV